MKAAARGEVAEASARRVPALQPLVKTAQFPFAPVRLPVSLAVAARLK